MLLLYPKVESFATIWNADLNNYILLDPQKGHPTQFGEPVGACLSEHVCPGKDKALSPTVPFSSYSSLQTYNTVVTSLFVPEHFQCMSL